MDVKTSNSLSYGPNAFVLITHVFNCYDERSKSVFCLHTSGSPVKAKS